MTNKLSVYTNPDVLFSLVSRTVDINTVQANQSNVQWKCTSGTLLWVLNEMIYVLFSQGVFQTSSPIKLSKWWVADADIQSAVEEECVSIMSEFKTRVASGEKHKLKLFAFPSKITGMIDLFLYLL